MIPHLKELMASSHKQIVILSAGMQRSGSTWLYNATRLLLLNSPLTREITGYGWIGDLSKLPMKRIMLLKIHDFSQTVLDLVLPDIILYSYRDVRDTLASMKRIWHHEPSLELADRLIWSDQEWRRHAHFILRYESMMNDKPGALIQLITMLQFNDAIDVQKICNAIEELKYEGSRNNKAPYDMVNLLYEGHITDGRHGSWKGELNDSLLEQIESKYREWFIQNDYPL